jgi:hypothetical protein
VGEGATPVTTFAIISRPWITGRDCTHYLNIFQITLFKQSSENDFCVDYEGWMCGERETVEAL